MGGKPGDFLRGQEIFLKAIAARKDERIMAQSHSVSGAVVIHDTAQISKSSLLGPNVVVGPNCQLGRWARLQNLCILGEGVEVKAEVGLNGVTVCPHKSIKEDMLVQPGKVVL